MGKLADMLAPVLDGDDYVIYMVTSENRRHHWRRVLYWVTLLLPLPIIPPYAVMQSWCLVACPTHATLVRLALHPLRIEETIAVPEWTPSLQHTFKQVEVDGRLFKKVTRVRTWPPQALAGSTRRPLPQ